MHKAKHSLDFILLSRRWWFQQEQTHVPGNLKTYYDMYILTYDLVLQDQSKSKYLGEFLILKQYLSCQNVEVTKWTKSVKFFTVTHPHAHTTIRRIHAHTNTHQTKYAHKHLIDVIPLPHLSFSSPSISLPLVHLTI